MKKILLHLSCLLFVSLCFISSPLNAQQIIINEVYNSASTGDEWLELLVVEDNLDIRSWDIRDHNGSGTAQAPTEFTTASLWSSLKKGTVIIVEGASGVYSEDTDPSDFSLVIKTSNATYFSGAGFTIAGSSEAVQIRNTSDTHVFGVSWQSGNSASLPSPKVHFSGTNSSSGTSISFNQDTQGELTSTGNWTFNNASPSAGTGNSATNIAWISSLRSITDGAGTARISPDTVSHDVTENYEIVYKRDGSVTITDMRIIIPESFDWSQDSADISHTNMTATVSVSGDTIYFNTLTLTADSTVITIQNITSPDSTASYSFRVQTKATVDYANVASSTNVLVFGVPVDIATIKTNDANGVPLRNGQMVTVRGVVTVANEFGGPSFIQDNTGGLAIFGSTVSANVSVGDEIVVSGLIQPFSGLCEIVSPILHSVISSGNEVTPLILTATQVTNDGAGGLEQYEGLLVRINGVTVAGSGSWVYQNYTITDASGTTDIRIDNGTNLIGAAIPGGSFDIVAVVSQFKSSSPYIGGYQLQPRSTNDVYAEGPMISTTPYESDMTSSSFRINWTTINEGTSRLKYGLTTAYELGTLEPDATLRTTHTVDVAGLQAATIYHIKAFSVANGDTSFGFDQLVSTSSPAGSTGQINVYFNKSVNTSVANGEHALGNQDFIALLVERINAAQHSIDAALYSFSAVNQGDVVANALVNAKNRGVKVRVICEYDNQSTGGNSYSILTGAGITVINDRYDATWYGAGLMHNKFLVIDYSGGDPEDVWVWTGSWNITNQGTVTDRQNVIAIQDVAVAGAYTAEFNEMWGSDTDTPNASNSRFGGRKLDNTPHRFIVNGTPVEVYFSPADKTSSKIQKTMEKAQSSVSGALLTFTRSDLASTVIAKKNAGKKTRFVMDNNTDTGNQFANLQSNGVDVHLAGGSGLLHHKYVLIDADDPGGVQYTSTGSHNWSNSAENSNDENTIIVQNARVANLYLQEFAARYYEAGGSDSIALALPPGFSYSPSSLDFDSIDIGTTAKDSFMVSNPGEGILNVSSVSSTDPRFTINPANATIAPSASQWFIVTFAPTIPGARTGNVIIAHTADGSPDTVTVQGYGIDTTVYLAVQADIKDGWNMLSVPVTVSNTLKDSVFPTATSLAYAYQGTYIYHISLSYGKGYWVKFSGDQTEEFFGSSIESASFSLSADWNMIGSISYPVPVASIVQVPAGIVRTNYFGYAGGYYIEDTLKPGKAYWVKVSQAGTLQLSASAPDGMEKAENVLDRLNSLEISDGNGKSQTLYFGTTQDESFPLSAFELPPVPPSGAFDVRFKNGNMVSLQQENNKTQGDFPIAIQGMAGPVKVKWSVSDKEKAYVLSTGDKRTAIKLVGVGETQLSSSIGQSLVLKISDREIPEVYSLGQNFPNPFNPATTVSFSLPKESFVTLKIYNSLGQVVQTVKELEQLDAGYHSIVIDAGMLSSGVYYYRFDASGAGDISTQFSETKSLMIVK